MKKCFLCGLKDSIIDFNNESFEKCFLKLLFRSKKKFMYGDLRISLDSIDNIGYHSTCYKKVTVLGNKYYNEFIQFCKQLDIPNLSINMEEQNISSNSFQHSSRGSSVEEDKFELTMETGDDETDDPLSKSGPNTSCAGNSNDERDGQPFSEPRAHKRPHNQYEKTYTTPEIETTIIKTEDDFDNSDSMHTNHRKDQYDEYDHFALMLASKIRKIKSEDDREILMNSIQNLAFQFYMKNKKDKNS